MKNPTKNWISAAYPKLTFPIAQGNGRVRSSMRLWHARLAQGLAKAYPGGKGSDRRRACHEQMD